jgi:predicted ATPase/class 3 adenylate cyclase
VPDPPLPTGTVTFLFTDVAGSTRLWERHPEPMRRALARHDALIERLVARHGGAVVRPRGEGDSRFAVFPRATDAVVAAAAIQGALHAELWPPETPLRVRLALHTGEADLRDGDYYGSAVNRCARLRAIAHGGQALVSRATYDLTLDALPPGVALRDLGEQRLSDLARPEQVFQLVGPDVPADFPPLRSLDALPHNLPRQLTSFVGRERELQEVAALLGAHRLVTLTGPGGTGKTRLALQVAADLLDASPDGVFFVPLAPVADPALVVPTIATSLGLREFGARPLLDALRDYLGDKRLLLVLDNFEHVVDAAPAVATLLAGCPRLAVLVTSRAVLCLSGEHDYPVPPLALPDAAVTQALSREPRANTALAVEQIAGAEAVRLFVVRARAARPDFALTPANAPAVAALCRRLDGLPLALELAAARTRLLPPPALLARLADAAGGPLRLLTGGPRDRPARQQTLRATIEWSYGLLTAHEQAVFRWLGVFAGGCTLEAAEAVCAAGDVLDGLGSLVDKSLLRLEEPAAGEPRYLMLETLRELALERLEASGEAAATRQRHAAYFLGVAERADAAMRRAGQAVGLARLEADHDNLRAALAWTLAEADAGAPVGAAEQALRLAGALSFFWFLRGHLSEGRRWLTRALERAAGVGRETHAAAAAPPRGLALALAGAGQLARSQGDYPEAERLIGESLAVCREQGDADGLAWGLSLLGIVARYRGDYGRSTALLEESVERYRATGDRFGRVWTLLNLGRTEAFRGNHERAAGLLAAGARGAQELGNPWGLARARTFQGQVAYARGEYRRAEAWFEESLALHRDAPGRGDPWASALALAGLGNVARAQGDSGRAMACYAQSLAASRELGDREEIARCLEDVAALAGAQARPRRAARLLGAAVAIREEIGTPVAPFEREAYERQVAALRSTLGVRDFATAWASGRAMSLEQAVADALEEAGDA